MSALSLATDGVQCSTDRPLSMATDGVFCPSAEVDAPPYVKFWPPDVDARYRAQALREDDELIIICQAFVEIIRCR